LEFIGEASRRHGLAISNIFHAGDGNLHPIILFDARKPGELEHLAAAAALTEDVGLECHAGHGLTFANVGPIAALKQVRELNIGHYLIGEALLTGLPAAVQEMRRLISAARG